MKGIGILLVLVGLIWAIYAFNMDTTVSTDAKTFGSGEYVVNVPSMTVNNLGLMETRRNNLMFAGLTMLAGVIFIGFGSISKASSTALPNGGVQKVCPFCAERIQVAALKCRYCSTDLPKIRETEDNQVQQYVALIKQGRATILTYTALIEFFGGRINRGVLGYSIDLNGKLSRVNSFNDLQSWYLNNVVPLLTSQSNRAD